MTSKVHLALPVSHNVSYALIG